MFNALKVVCCLSGCAYRQTGRQTGIYINSWARAPGEKTLERPSEIDAENKSNLYTFEYVVPFLSLIHIFYNNNFFLHIEN